MRDDQKRQEIQEEERIKADAKVAEEIQLRRRQEYEAKIK